MNGKPFLIGISGGSGSGKTTILLRLRNIFPEEKLCILSQDEYYHPRDKQRRDDAGYQNFDLPESIDHDAFAGDIAMLLNGEEVTRDQYTFNNANKQSMKLVFRPAPVIIVEGLFVFYFESIRNMIDLKIFIDAEDIIKLKRRIIRDAGERNYPLEDVLHRYEHHVLPSFRTFIEPYRRQADIIVNNHSSHDKAIDVLKALIDSRL